VNSKEVVAQKNTQSASRYLRVARADISSLRALVI